MSTAKKAFARGPFSRPVTGKSLSDLVAKVAKRAGGRKGSGYDGALSWMWEFSIEESMEKIAIIQEAMKAAGFKQSGTEKSPLGAGLKWSHSSNPGVYTVSYAINNRPRQGLVAFQIRA